MLLKGLSLETCPQCRILVAKFYTCATLLPSLPLQRRFCSISCQSYAGEASEKASLTLSNWSIFGFFEHRFRVYILVFAFDVWFQSPLIPPRGRTCHVRAMPSVITPQIPAFLTWVGVRVGDVFFTPTFLWL